MSTEREKVPKSRTTAGRANRKGVIAVLSAIVLAAMFAFVAMAVDTSRIVTLQTELQNAVDAAALAASQEITGQIQQAGEGEGDANIDANSIAVASARQVAVDIAEANGVFVDPAQDVLFGKRTFDESTGTWPIAWGVSPYNVVKVVARRDNPDTTAQDGMLRLAFGWAVGNSKVPLSVSASAFVETRDIVLVLDFSGSMNDDSSMRSFNSLGQSNVEASLDAMWDSLVAADPKWPGTSESKFPSTGWGQINSYAGTYLSTSDVNTAYNSLGLSGKTFPQAGRNSNGHPKNKPGSSTSATQWKNYIKWVKSKSGTYKKKYGYRTLMDYLQEKRYSSNKSEDLWRTPHYPFNAVKNGASLFCDFLEDLDFGDQLGLVSYATYARQETSFDDGELSFDLSSDPITENYELIDTIQRRKQAAHYANTTGMGYGVEAARELILGDPDNASDDGAVRNGSRPTMIIMTDGLANQSPGSWSLPSNWDWADWTDYDGDGSADYTTSDRHKQFAFWQATHSFEMGITCHTMSVGAGADTSLMEAIAFASGGTWLNIPGGATVADMEQQMLAAFGRIAAKVPPPKLIFDDTAP